MSLLRYVVLEKKVGETPLVCAENWRVKHPDYQGLPLAYAGRLDPMASGKLLVLIGDECKVQEHYHGLDKQYEFSVLFGIGSDTGDVLGRLVFTKDRPAITGPQLKTIAHELTGSITLPYPHFSAKTVKGKPLHVWTLEGRLNEITIPKQHSIIYSLKLKSLVTRSRSEIYQTVSKKIETIPAITALSKALGQDFRRVDVRQDWLEFLKAGNETDQFFIATFVCKASAGTYMRSLAEEIGRLTKTSALAYHINRQKIGRFKPLPIVGGLWLKQF